MANLQYFLTYHAIERFQERFPEITKENNKVKSWKRPQDVEIVKDFFDDLVNQSEENRAYFNNTSYMVKVYETYGYDSEYKFMENLQYGILFVIAKDRNEKHFRLVTIMPTEYRKKFCLTNQKYKDKEKKEDKKQKRILEMYEEYQKTILSFENPRLTFIDRLSELEKHSNFNQVYQQHLSEFLMTLTKLEQQKNKKGSVLQFSSKKYSYSFVVKENYAQVLEVKQLSNLQMLERTNYFKIQEEIFSLLNVSELKETYNKNVALRSVIANYMRYNFKYYENLHQIEIMNTETLSEEQLLQYATTTDIMEKINNNITQHYYIVVDSEKNLHQTYIEGKQCTFFYEQNSVELKLLKIEYIDFVNLEIEEDVLKDKLMQMSARNETNILKVFNANKKLRIAKTNKKEIHFMYLAKIKQVVLISFKDIQNYNTHSYLNDNIDYDKEYLDQFTNLTESLPREDEIFFKKCANEDNMIKFINKKKSIHRIQYKGDCYDFLFYKTKAEGYLITLFNKKTGILN